MLCKSSGHNSARNSSQVVGLAACKLKSKSRQFAEKNRGVGGAKCLVPATREGRWTRPLRQARVSATEKGFSPSIHVGASVREGNTVRLASACATSAIIRPVTL